MGRRHSSGMCQGPPRGSLLHRHPHPTDHPCPPFSHACLVHSFHPTQATGLDAALSAPSAPNFTTPRLPGTDLPANIEFPWWFGYKQVGVCPARGAGVPPRTPLVP